MIKDTAALAVSNEIAPAIIILITDGGSSSG